jgi:hypothetical protein
MKVHMICLALSFVGLIGLGADALGQTKPGAKKESPLATRRVSQRPLGQSQRSTVSSHLPAAGRRPFGQLRPGGKKEIPSAGSRPPGTGRVGYTPRRKPSKPGDVQAPGSSAQPQIHQAVPGGLKKE